MAPLATSRPVVDITILDHSHTDWNRLFKSLTQTTAPVTSVCLAVPGHTWQQWEAFISQSRSTQLCSTLTEIRVAETLPIYVGVHTPLENLGIQPSHLVGFDILERLELFRPAGMYTSTKAVRTWLRHMGQLAIWIAAAPSLKSVVIYGYELH